ncbi:MAG TPA: hypothetical protein VKZ53_19270 [Candidatus Angelobacter sp.]|nr:hypothetical protein [Candidatus Angelobacter sp.]
MNIEFLSEFKHTTEARWRDRPINPDIYGFQIQPGTRWNPGLPNSAIAEYERILAVRFPFDFSAFLGEMNGTDLPTLNVYGSRGMPSTEGVGVYSFPRDIELVKQRIEDVRSLRNEITANLSEQGVDLPDQAGLVPIYSHRFVVCAEGRESSAVLSISGADAIVYGDSLQECLTREFLNTSG